MQTISPTNFKVTFCLGWKRATGCQKPGRSVSAGGLLVAGFCSVTFLDGVVSAKSEVALKNLTKVKTDDIFRD
ncbi:MAG: hypothetical protein ACRC6M_01985 [Microcystaceae cyanobacterium]